MFEIIILGKPVPLKRARAGISKNKIYFRDPSFKEKEEFRKDLIREFQGQSIITSPVNITIKFFLKYPCSKTKKNRSPHAVRPDIDNLAKFVLDASKDILFKDDSQIYMLHLEKYYDNLPRTEIIIHEDV